MDEMRERFWSVREPHERLQFTLSPRIFRRIVPRNRSASRFGRGARHFGGRLSNKYLLKLYVAGSTPRATARDRKPQAHLRARSLRPL